MTLSYFPDVLLLFFQNVKFCSRKIPLFLYVQLCCMILVWAPIQYEDDTLPV